QQGRLALGARAHVGEAVLQAIADLTQVIRSEFAKVNAKLDEILELLQHIVQEIRDMRWELKAVQEQVVQLDRKVNGLLIGVNDQFLQTASHALLQRHAVARTLARNRLFQPERMAEFRAFYAQAALEASQAPYILDLQSTELSRLGLAEAFSEGASGDVEQYKRQLLDVLANDFGLHLAGAPVFEPVLRIALEGYADVCLSDPAAFNMLDQMERDEQAETIRGVLFAHTSLMEDLRRQAAGGKGPGPVDHLLADYARQVSAFQDAWTVARTDAQVAYMAKVERGEWPDQRFASGPLYLGAAAQPGLQLLGDQYFGPGGPVANRFCTFIPQAAGEAPVHPLRLEIVNWVFGGRDPWSAGHQRYFGKITAHVRFHGTVIPGSQFEVNVLLWVQGPKILQAEQDLNDIMLLLSLADAPAGHTSGVEVLVNAFVATLSSGAAKDWVYQQQLYRLGAYPLGTQVLQAEEFLRQGPLHPCCTALTSMERTARAVRALTRIAYPDAYAASDPLHALFGPTPDTGMVGTALLAGWSTFVLELQRAPTAVLARTDPAALRWRAALLPGWQGPAAVPVALLPDLAARRSQYLAQVIGQVFAAGRQRGETFRFARAHRMFEAAIETVIGSGVNDSNVFSSTAVVRRLRRQTQTALARHRPGKPATPDAPPAPVRAAHV
ncbi:hypothetical protein, partial [Zemynaea arenosa]|uniref:hypothetical protein n=1 Tax=Zemynaea arenosa TaxID=2561931 RepID=UPI001430AA8A